MGVSCVHMLVLKATAHFTIAYYLFTYFFNNKLQKAVTCEH